jgi:IclR family transcriptional regulator, acetate operon repressor
MSRQPTRIQSVTRAAALLEFVATDPAGRTVGEVADAVGVPLPTAYHLLNTLVDAGLLAKSEGRRYQLGARIGLLAEAFLAQMSAPHHLMEHVRGLAHRTGETAYLSAWRNGDATLLSVVEGHRAVRVAGLHVGYAGVTHARASGKVLLASGPPGTLERYLDSHDIVSRTRRQPGCAEALRLELDRVRNQGYAIDEEEFSEGVACIAAPVIDGTLALGISAPVERYQAMKDELISAVVSFAAKARSFAPIPVEKAS